MLQILIMLACVEFYVKIDLAGLECADVWSHMISSYC